MGYNSKLSYRNHFLSSFKRVSTMPLESTQPLTEILERQGRKADNLTAICEPIV
jgi:hypothetical protein